MNKRNIRKAEEFNEKDQKGFFMIGKKDASIAILNKLTGTQMRLWVYLMMIDTFADFTKDGEKIYKLIPSPQEIGIQLGIHHETVTKDLRKLKKLDLYDYRIVNWQGHNTTAYKASLQSSELKKKRNSRGDVKYGSNRGDVEYGNSRYDVKYESTSLAHNSETCNKRSVHFHTITDEDQTYRISTEQTTGVSIDDEGVAMYGLNNIKPVHESYTGYALGLNNPSQGLNNLSKGLNNLFGGLNNPQFGLNNPSFFTKLLPCNDFSLSQTVQTIQTKQKKTYSLRPEETERTK